MKKTWILTKIKTISGIWVALMCAGLLLRSKYLTIRICCGTAVSLFILGVGLTIAILDFAKGRHIFPGILCLLLSFALAIVAPAFSGLNAIQNPFSSQQFASELDTNFLLKGTVAYYRKCGPLLYSPQRSGQGNFSSDPNYVYVDKNGIYVSSTMSFGARYDIKNSAIDLRGKEVETWHITHKSYYWQESFTLTDQSPYLLVYSNSDGIEKSCALDDAVYKKLIGMLERLPLAEQPADGSEDTFHYLLDIDMKDDDAGYFAAVDGEETFSFMESCLERQT